MADLRPGDHLPGITVTVGAAQMFFFSAAVYNGHRIHYDRHWAGEVEGYQGLLVQGALQSALLARVVTDWMGGAGRLRRFGSQNRGAAYVDDTLTFSGTVKDVIEDGEELVVQLELRGENARGELLMPGTAEVTFAHESGLAGQETQDD